MTQRTRHTHRIVRDGLNSGTTTRLILIFTIFGMLCLNAPAQQNSAPPAAQTSSPPASASEPKSTTQSEEEKKIEKKEQSQRVLGVLPQFGVTSRQNAPPLTTAEKFRLFAKSAFDPATIGIVGLQAGLSQAENEFPGYGQGAEGFGKRFGASFADEVSSGFFSNFAYPSLLKEDPRYFRLGEGGFGHRVVYGVKQEFVCHTDKGGRSFNFSNVLGAFTSGALSNLYYPGRTLIRTIPATGSSPAIPVYENDRGVALTMSRASIALGYGTIGGLVDEFWPDIHRKLFHKSNREQAQPTGAQP
ncbi:MAG TPA: hypothetical protein VMG31_16555 [Verrucomicrobiae bacterium]|nr:hypothetical protein [Verrucomicrobiae bacterium]